MFKLAFFITAGSYLIASVSAQNPISWLGFPTAKTSAGDGPTLYVFPTENQTSSANFLYDVVDPAATGLEVRLWDFSRPDGDRVVTTLSSDFGAANECSCYAFDASGLASMAANLTSGTQYHISVSAGEVMVVSGSFSLNTEGGNGELPNDEENDDEFEDEDDDENLEDDDGPGAGNDTSSDGDRKPKYSSDVDASSFVTYSTMPLLLTAILAMSFTYM